MRNKYLVIARLAAPLRDQIMSALFAHCGVTSVETDWPADNLHLSLSDRHYFSDAAAMLEALARVKARAFDLTLNRMTYEQSSGHLTLRAKGEKPREFVELVEWVRRALGTEAIKDVTGHTAHVTLSYKSPIRPKHPIHISPMTFPVESFELVIGGGEPYTYTTVERWPLAPRMQSDLFA